MAMPEENSKGSRRHQEAERGVMGDFFHGAVRARTKLVLLAGHSHFFGTEVQKEGRVARGMRLFRRFPLI